MQTSIRWFQIFLALMALSTIALAQNKEFSASNGAFSFKAPAAFQKIGDAPPNALVALEVPGYGVSFLSERQEAVELETSTFATEMKKKLSDSGAQILGSAQADLGGRPAVSFLVGGVKKGKESLFVFNTRADHTYVFVLNYPVGSRKDAAELWQDIAPTITFKK